MCEESLVAEDLNRSGVRGETPVEQQKQLKCWPAYRDVGPVVAVPPGDTGRAADNQRLAARCCACRWWPVGGCGRTTPTPSCSTILYRCNRPPTSRWATPSFFLMIRSPP